MGRPASYLDLVLNPFNLLRTKRILKVNPHHHSRTERTGACAFICI